MTPQMQTPPHPPLLKFRYVSRVWVSVSFFFSFFFSDNTFSSLKKLIIGHYSASSTVHLQIALCYWYMFVLNVYRQKLAGAPMGLMLVH